MTSGLRSLSFIGYILWFIFAFYLTLSLHELGHFLAFYFQKIKLRALYLTVFVFYRNQKGWHFKIRPKLWVLLGGLVVPDLGEIKNDTDYEILKTKFSKSLIVAPLVTIGILTISLISFILVMTFGTHTHFTGIITINTLYITVLSILYIYTFRLSNQMFYGDFIAYKKMKSDPIFQLAQINQYTMFSLEESDVTVRYLWEKSRDIIREHPVSTSLFYIMILTNYFDGILRMNYEVDSDIDQKINRINMASLCRSEQGLSLAYDFSFYDYKKGDIEKAYQRFDLIQKKIGKKLNQKMVTYLKNKTLHVMHREDHSQFLSLKENLYIGNAWIFEGLVNPYDMLTAYHQKLSYIEYSCPVVFEQKEEQKSDLS